MGRISLRFAVEFDAGRLVHDGVLTGPLPPGESWEGRMHYWLEEMLRGRRLIIIAQGAGTVEGIAQLVFRFPEGHRDREAADGVESAMVEMVRARPGPHSATVSSALMREVEMLARQRRFRRLTYLVPMENNRAIAQVKSWGFEEFRIMPEGNRMLAFFKKSLA